MGLHFEVGAYILGDIFRALPYCVLFWLVNGGYTEWTPWSVCSKTCGGGSQLRNRNCTSPLPVDGGLDCADLNMGGDEESRQCNVMVCPGQIGMLVP